MLSKELRDDLNERLQNGEEAAPILEWLNGLEEVKSVLQLSFNGQPINEPNLSAWRHSGYEEWLLAEERLEMMFRLREEAASLKAELHEPNVGDWMGLLVGAEIAGLSQKLLDKEPDPEKRWKQLCDMHKQISRLRQDEHRAIRTRIQKKEWEKENDKRMHCFF